MFTVLFFLKRSVSFFLIKKAIKLICNYQVFNFNYRECKIYFQSNYKTSHITVYQTGS